jgi:hypothetical protein
MANPVTIDIPGIGSVVANNAATEATLKEILKAIQGGEGGGYKKGGKPGDAKNKEYSGGSGGGGSGGGGGGSGGGKGAASSAMGLFGLGKAVGTLGRYVGIATGAFIGVGEAATEVVAQFANVGDSMENAAAVFKSIPLLGTVFGAVASAAEKTLASYQSATASGATFGNSMGNFAAAASSAGMTMDKFAAIIGKNGAAMQILGGNTEEGARRFASISKDLRTSQVGAQLAGLGYSSEQINQGMASYANIIGRSGALQGKSNKEIAAGAGAYMKELDALAKVTGRSRQELENEADERAKDAQWIAMTRGMDKDQRLMMESFVSSYPKEQQAAIKDMLTTGSITSDAAIKFNAMMGGTAQEVMQMGQAIKSGRKLTQSEIDKTKNNSISEAVQKANSAEFKTMGGFVGEFANEVNGINQLANQETNGRKKAMTAQEQAEANAAAGLKAFKENLAELSNGFQIALVNSGVLNSLMSLFTTFADIVQRFIIPIFNIMAAIIPKVVYGFELLLAPVVEAISGLFGDTSNTLQMLDDIMNAVFPILDATVRSLILVFEGAWDAVMSLFEPIKNLMDEIFGAGNGMSGLTDIIIDTGNFIGGVFRMVGGIVGGLIDGFTWLIRTVKSVIGSSEVLTSYFDGLAKGIKAIWTWIHELLSVDGGKAVVMWLGNMVLKIMYYLQDTFGSMIDGVLAVIPNAIGGISAEEKKKRDEDRAERAKTRDEETKARDAEVARLHESSKKEVAANDKKAEHHKQALKQDVANFNKKESHLSKMGGLQKKEEDLKEESIVKNYDDPLALLTAHATQQKSGLIQTPAGTPVANAEGGRRAVEQAAEAKVQAEKAAAEKASGKGGGTIPGSTAPAGPAQESPSVLLASLNTKMDQLIKISKDHHDIGAVQVRTLGQLSGDLYAGVG